MTCAACPRRFKKVVNKQEDVKKASVNLTTESVSIEYDLKPKADKGEKQTHKEKQLKQIKMKLIISAVLSAPLLVTMLVHMFGVSLPAIFMNQWFQFALATPIQFIIGWQFYVGTYKKL
nr:cation transporter [Virgibacillus phasianinus]